MDAGQSAILAKASILYLEGRGCDLWPQLVQDQRQPRPGFDELVLDKRPGITEVLTADLLMESRPPFRDMIVLAALLYLVRGFQRHRRREFAIGGVDRRTVALPGPGIQVDRLLLPGCNLLGVVLTELVGESAG